MPDDDDLNQRFNAISVPELRRRVDLAISYVREMRRALAVHAGMTLEDTGQPIPPLELDTGKRAFEEMLDSLPLLRRRLTAEERAQLKPISEAQRQASAELLETGAEMDPEEFQATVDELGIQTTHEHFVALRDDMKKTDMLGELQLELELYLEEVRAYRTQMEEEMQALARKLFPQGGPTN